MHQTINKRVASAPAEIIDRRRTRRFDVAWPVIIRGVDEHGQSFEAFSSLQNLSPAGAAVGLMVSLPTGARVEMDVCCPLSRRHWLRYWGRIVSVESYAEQRIVSVAFESAKPAFVPAAAVVRLHLIPPKGCIPH
ncbi:MAG: PilZ domain-containing protein [Blastocatellia bacterium]